MTDVSEDDKYYIRPDGTIDIQRLIGRGYNRFWNWKGLYLVVKGSRGSKKSKTAALKMVYQIMAHPLANGLCIRQVAETLRDSCWADLKWAVHKFKADKYWKFTKTPLEAIYHIEGKPDQKILFRGLDDPMKVTSISVDYGFLNLVWIEEAYQITDGDAFEMLEMSIRGKLPEPGSPNYDPLMYYQFIVTFNPWSEDTWLKSRFFDNSDPEILALTTTYRCNEHLSDKDIARYEKIAETNPKRAKVVCDGEWGISEGLVYENWDMADWFDPVELMGKNPRLTPIFGLDFGYAVSYTGFVALLVDVEAREVWVFDEIYERGLVNLEIAKRICEMGYGKERIVADSAEPKSIFDLQQGIIEETVNIDGSKSYTRWALPDINGIHKTTIEFGISLVQSYRIHVHPKCKSTMYELNNYSFATDKDGKYTGKPVKDFDHILDAMRYALTTLSLSGHASMREVRGNSVYQPPSAPLPIGMRSDPQMEGDMAVAILGDKRMADAPSVLPNNNRSRVFGPRAKPNGFGGIDGKGKKTTLDMFVPHK